MKGKRVFDFWLSLTLLTFFSPIVLCLSALILLETGRPVLYLNDRVGYKGKRFKLVKFREYYQCFCTDSQFVNSRAALELEKKLVETFNQRKGSLYKIQNDPRRSAVGRFIERHYFGEIPNLWNVLKGEMSLVGPRPHQERELKNLDSAFPKRHSILPGVTGLAQISGGSKLDTSDEFIFDCKYIVERSFRLDFKILIRTLVVWIKTWL